MCFGIAFFAADKSSPLPFAPVCFCFSSCSTIPSCAVRLCAKGKAMKQYSCGAFNLFIYLFIGGKKRLPKTGEGIISSEHVSDQGHTVIPQTFALVLQRGLTAS